MSYDANGNLLALGGYQFTWSDRRLTGASGAHSIAYTYDYNGIRTSKTIDGSTISYTVDENNNVIAQTNGTDTLRFVYDSNGAPVYMEYNGTVYYYEKNLQGDIVGILDTSGTTVVQYSYDIWGKLLGITGDLADTVGTANPLRYRGYYYDTETELYYLQSRYYSPELMRFISMDDAALSNAQGEPIGSNLYAYCLNNPANNSDESGCGPFLAIGLQFVITVGRLTFGLEALWSTLNWRFYLFAFVGGSRSFNVSSIKEIEGALMQDLLLLRRSVKGFSLSSFGRFKKFGVSVSFIAVLGNRYATFPSDYCGWFTGISLSFLNVTVSGAYGYSGSAKIGSIGVGATTSKADANWGQTFYFQLTGNNAFKNSWSGFLSGIKNRLERFKMFACFFY